MSHPSIRRAVRDSHADTNDSQPLQVHWHHHPPSQFEEEEDSATREALTDEEIYARRKPPTSIVIRYGSMRLVAEFPYDGPAKPGCGSKLVVRTSRGMEIGEMLTTTCPNSGCGKSVSREQLLDYIDQSGGHQYPFRTDGKILRVASVEDLNRWSTIQSADPK